MPLRPGNVFLVGSLQNTILSGASSSASFVSSVAWGYDIVRASFQITVSSGASSGLCTLQVSNDQATGAPANQFVPTNWSTIGSASVTCSTSATLNTFLIPVTEFSYEYIRVKYTDLSGGAANGVMSIKMKSQGI